MRLILGELVDEGDKVFGFLCVSGLVHEELLGGNLCGVGWSREHWDS